MLNSLLQQLAYNGTAAAQVPNDVKSIVPSFQTLVFGLDTLIMHIIGIFITLPPFAYAFINMIILGLAIFGILSWLAHDAKRIFLVVGIVAGFILAMPVLVPGFKFPF